MKKTLLTSLAVFLLIFVASSCKKKDDDIEIIPPATVKTITNESALEKIYFNLTQGVFVHKDSLTNDNWDISFYAAELIPQIAVNSGNSGEGNVEIALIESEFSNLFSAPESGYMQGNEATEPYTTWAVFTDDNEPINAVLPKEDISFVVKTAAGKYSKIQILSLYEGNPNTASEDFKDTTTRPTFGYFTFRYATQQGDYSKF